VILALRSRLDLGDRSLGAQLLLSSCKRDALRSASTHYEHGDQNGKVTHATHREAHWYHSLGALIANE
jgi:hypothetical protein